MYRGPAWLPEHRVAIPSGAPARPERCHVEGRPARWAEGAWPAQPSRGARVVASSMTLGIQHGLRPAGQLWPITSPAMRDPEVPKYVSQNRRRAESKVRRSGTHCPVCLAPLEKNVKRTRLQQRCTSCRAHPSREKRCRKCSAQAIWENKLGVACQACGAHGAKEAVVHQ